MQAATDWVESPVYQVVDRSDLESMDCPQAAQFVRKGIVLNRSIAMDSGNAVHEALSQATRSYVSSRGALNANETTEEAKQNLLFETRPDLIWHAWEGFSPSARSWGWFITKLHADNILRFDGGEGDRSGQLAFDYPDLKLRPTTELDLLHSGPSREVLHIVDYKSGFARWTAEAVKNAFQFRFQSYQVFENYPEVSAVEVRIWDTRYNSLTYGVEFRRDRDHEPIHWEIRKRAELWKKYHDKEPDQVPAHPDVERCLRCPAVTLCMHSKHLAEPINDPERYLLETAAMERIVDARKELLEEAVKRRGSDIVASDGTCFGLDKPKANRKTEMKIYTRKAVAEE